VGLLTGVRSNSVHLCRDRESLKLRVAVFRRHQCLDPCRCILHHSHRQLFPGHDDRPRHCKAIALYVNNFNVGALKSRDLTTR